MALKGNQGNLYQSAMDFVIENMENDFADVAARTYTERLKGHGRADQITYHQIPIPRILPGK